MVDLAPLIVVKRTCGWPQITAFIKLQIFVILGGNSRNPTPPMKAVINLKWIILRSKLRRSNGSSPKRAF
jgi:hypothetical protein